MWAMLPGWHPHSCFLKVSKTLFSDSAKDKVCYYGMKKKNLRESCLPAMTTNIHPRTRKTPDSCTLFPQIMDPLTSFTRFAFFFFYKGRYAERDWTKRRCYFLPPLPFCSFIAPLSFQPQLFMESTSHFLDSFPLSWHPLLSIHKHRFYKGWRTF